MNRIDIPKDVMYILKSLNEKGYEAYIVGGCVRDAILNIIPKDWDITTSAKPEEVKKCFDKTFDTGIQHGTVTAVINKNNYEITTYRIEDEYDDCRHPNKVYFTDKLTDDLLRRDFTMNAIAYHPDEGFKDPFGGIDDIKIKTIRGVGNPSERFNEDALRMLRAVRFSAQLGFDIENETLEALKQNVSLIKKISVERIREEISKLIKSDFIEKIPLLWETGLLYEISSEINNKVLEEKENIIKSLYYKPKDDILCWSVFLKGFDGEEAKKILRYIKFDLNTIKSVSKLLEYKNYDFPNNDYEIKKLANIIGKENIENWFKLYSLINNKELGEKGLKNYNDIIYRNECVFQKDMDITGNDLIDIGFEKGKKLGEVLAILLDYVHKNPNENNKNSLLSKAKEYI